MYRVGFLLASLLAVTSGFSIAEPSALAIGKARLAPRTVLYAGNGRFTNEQRRKLGMDEDDDEYDLDMALENNTDPLITKIVAGSFIVSILALLLVGFIIPYTTDYGEGVCNALLTGGRC
jgi:hypothetical protein